MNGILHTFSEKLVSHLRDYCFFSKISCQYLLSSIGLALITCKLYFVEKYNKKSVIRQLFKNNVFDKLNSKIPFENPAIFHLAIPKVYGLVKLHHLEE